MSVARSGKKNVDAEESIATSQGGESSMFSFQSVVSAVVGAAICGLVLTNFQQQPSPSVIKTTEYTEGPIQYRTVENNVYDLAEFPVGTAERYMAIRHLDRDHDGTISPEEIFRFKLGEEKYAYMLSETKRKQELCAARLQKATENWSELDVDGQGYVSLLEFHNFLKKHHPTLGKNEVGTLYADIAGPDGEMTKADVYNCVGMSSEDIARKEQQELKQALDLLDESLAKTFLEMAKDDLLTVKEVVTYWERQLPVCNEYFCSSTSTNYYAMVYLCDYNNDDIASKEEIIKKYGEAAGDDGSMNQVDFTKFVLDPANNQTAVNAVFDEDLNGVVTGPEIVVVFVFIDKNADGIVSLGEFLNFVEKPQQAAVKEKALVDKLDTDNDGQVSSAEITSGAKKMDLNGDGIISPAEFVANMSPASLAAEERALASGMLALCDANGDGTCTEDEIAVLMKKIDKSLDSIITVEEFVEWAQAEDDRAAKIKLFDLDGDKEITPDEVVKVFDDVDVAGGPDHSPGVIELQEFFLFASVTIDGPNAKVAGVIVELKSLKAAADAQDHKVTMTEVFNLPPTTVAQPTVSIALASDVLNAADPTPETPITIPEVVQTLVDKQPENLQGKVDVFAAFTQLMDLDDNEKLDAAEIIALFKEVDANGNGILEKQEIENWFLAGKDDLSVFRLIPEVWKPLPKTTIEETIVYSYSKMDTTKDGKVSTKEFESYVRTVETKTLNAIADKNGDGVTDTTEIHEWFRQIDKDGDGTMTKMEFSHYYKKAAKGAVDAPAKEAIADTNKDGVVSPAEATAMAASIDKDNSGTVNQVELITAITKAAADAAKAGAYQAAFDTNGDGKVTPEEIKEVIKGVDTDNSGTISPTELKEFIVGTPEVNQDEAAKAAAATTLLDTNNSKKIEEKEVADFVAKVDTNKDGKLSESEVAATITKPGTLAEDAAKKTLIDTNGDKKIEPNEIHIFFFSIDINGDKQLSVDELKKFFL